MDVQTPTVFSCCETASLDLYLTHILVSTSKQKHDEVTGEVETYGSQQAIHALPEKSDGSEDGGKCNTYHIPTSIISQPYSITFFTPS